MACQAIVVTCVLPVDASYSENTSNCIACQNGNYLNCFHQAMHKSSCTVKKQKTLVLPAALSLVNCMLLAFLVAAALYFSSSDIDC